MVVEKLRARTARTRAPPHGPEILFKIYDSLVRDTYLIAPDFPRIIGWMHGD